MKIQSVALVLTILLSAGVSARAEGPLPPPPPLKNTDGFTNTPIVPGTTWHVHDPNRPQPEVVTPGDFSTQEAPGKPPSDAIVLFNGADVSKWRTEKGEPAQWKVEKSELIESKGSIFTKEVFGDVQLHVEFQCPPPKGHSQERGNSGIFLMGLYEVQVLDSYQNATYADGALGAMYGQHPPLVNVARPPGEWQVYDIVFHPPHFDDSGKLKSPAIATVFLNGVLVQDHQTYDGPTGWKMLGHYSPQPATGPISLQDHNNVTRFRNIWVRPLKAAQ
jgi:hypothetical protein